MHLSSGGTPGAREAPAAPLAAFSACERASVLASRVTQFRAEPDLLSLCSATEAAALLLFLSALHHPLFFWSRDPMGPGHVTSDVEEQPAGGRNPPGRLGWCFPPPWNQELYFQ